MTNSTIKKPKNKHRIQRAKKGTQEFFTPDFIIDVMIDNCPEEMFRTLQPFHESCCGNGNILEKVYKKYREFHDHETALSAIYGFDFMPDNVIEAIRRLYGDGDIKRLDEIPEDMKSLGVIAVFTHNGVIVKNIICADALTYNISFGPDGMMSLV